MAVGKSGTIYKRQVDKNGRGVFQVRVYLGRDPATGKRINAVRTVHGTVKDAQKVLRDLLAEKDSGRPVEMSKLSVSAYLDRWLKTSARKRLDPETYKGYEQVLDLYVRPKIGRLPLKRLTGLHVQELYNELGEGTLGPGTIRRVHTALGSALKQAVIWRIIDTHPFEGVDLPRYQRTEFQVFDREEAKRFLAACEGHKYGLLYEFALVTGMRPGEYLGLQWPELDLEAGIVAVKQSLTEISGENGAWRLKEPKTKSGCRSVTIPLELCAKLKVHRTRQKEQRLMVGPEWKGEGFVFTTDLGGHVPGRTLHHNFGVLRKRAGLEKAMRPYDLRHTCATLLLLAGENPKVVSERLGHASVAITLDTYSHVLPTLQQQASDKLRSVLYGNGTL